VLATIDDKGPRATSQKVRVTKTYLPLYSDDDPQRAAAATDFDVVSNQNEVSFGGVTNQFTIID
jgi:hypothetical protein